MNAIECMVCGRSLAEGESAWASDWTVIDVTGTTAATRFVTRYTCDDCEADQ